MKKDMKVSLLNILMFDDVDFGEDKLWKYFNELK